ncbi:MAG: glycosyltransferase [Candidatus Rokubacteria bacterium]|nr:glycosyltransferase [Candidatus Rokubacteria bacterium]
MGRPVMPGRTGTRVLRVVHVLHSLEVGGTENGTVNVINGLREGFQHTVVTMTRSGVLARRLAPGTEVHCLGKRPALDLAATVRLARLLRRLRPDIVHSRNWAAFDGVLAARLARVPIVVHGEHGRGADDPRGTHPRRNRLRRMFAPWVDRFVAVSGDLTRWLVETVRIPAPKVLTIMNGVDMHRFGPHGRRTGRRALGVPDGWVVLGSVGRLDPVKDHGTLLEAFAKLSHVHPATFLVLVGDGPCRPALEARVHDLGIASRVRLAGERQDVAALLPAMDVYVLPSIAEGISNTILEAMAAALPVVATRTGGNPELVADGVTGSLVPVQDACALRTTLEAYVADADLRTARGSAGHRRVQEHFSLDRMRARYRSLYEELASPAATADRADAALAVEATRKPSETPVTPTGTNRIDDRRMFPGPSAGTGPAADRFAGAIDPGGRFRPGEFRGGRSPLRSEGGEAPLRGL